MSKHGLLYRCKWSLLKRLGARQILAECQGMKLSLRLSEVSARLMYFGQYEPEEACHIAQVVKPGMVVADIGANIGYFTLFLAQQVGSEGRVYAFEPNARVRTRLQQNIALNPQLAGRIEVLATALGAQASQAPFYCPIEGHEGVGGLRDTQRAPLQNVEAVCVSTLDQIVAERQIRRLDFIKLDVEGGELDVLRGASNVLTALKPRLLFEACDDNAEAYGYRVFELLSYLESRAYTVRQAGVGYNFAASPECGAALAGTRSPAQLPRTSGGV